MKADKLTDEQIEAAAQEALTNSLGGPDSDVGQLRLRNIEAYNALPIGEFAPPDVADRSDFVATDVADTINGILPNLMQMFVGGDDAVEFEGRGQDGSEQEAKLATAYVNHLFFVDNDGVSIIHDWFHDALLQKVGFAMVWAEEDAEDSKQSYEGQSQEQLVMLMQDGWQLEGEPEQDDQGLLNFTVKKEDRRVGVKVAAIAPHEMRVDANARWDDEPAMVGRVFYKRKFEWEEEGYDLSELGGGTQHSDAEAQELLGEASDYSHHVAHESHALFKGAEIFIKLDADGDGIAEWLKICLIEDRLAVYADSGKKAWEQVDGHPFVWICPNPRPHSFYGDCPADFAFQPQKLRTRTIRAIEDNMLLTVNQRTYVNTNAHVNIDDVLDSRAGGVIRGQGPGDDALMPIVQPSLGAPAYQFNEYIASWAETRTGYNRYSAGTDQNALNKTKGGMEMLSAKADMRMGLSARHFAVGVRKLFAKMLKLAIKHQNVEQMVALHGQFVPINPSEFRTQFRCKINVGLGTGTKEQQASRIMGLMQVMQGGMMAGVVQPKHLAEAIRLYAEAQEYKNPERFVDAEPSGMPPNPQAYAAEKEQAGQQMEELQGQLQKIGQKGQQLEQENQQLKMDAEMAKLEAKHKEILDAAKQFGGELDAREGALDAKESDVQARAESEQGLSAEVDAIAQQVAALTAAVTHILSTQQPPMDGDPGMDAPAAPLGNL